MDKFEQEMEEQDKDLLKQCKQGYTLGIVSFVVITLVLATEIYYDFKIWQIMIQVLSLSLIFWSIRKMEKTMNNIKKRLENYGK